MIYAHHVPQHDAADKLTALLDARSPAETRRTLDARSGTADEGAERNRLNKGDSDAGGETRTPDTRIMIPLL
jgi:hypothetical protein